jgi:hypothetical protein
MFIYTREQHRTEHTHTNSYTAYLYCILFYIYIDDGELINIFIDSALRGQNKHKLSGRIMNVLFLCKYKLYFTFRTLNCTSAMVPSICLNPHDAYTMYECIDEHKILCTRIYKLTILIVLFTSGF